jgi:hypothetical protein
MRDLKYLQKILKNQSKDIIKNTLLDEESLNELKSHAVATIKDYMDFLLFEDDAFSDEISNILKEKLKNLFKE